MILALLLLVFLVVALLSGFVGSLAGLGGGVVLIPIFVVFFQVPFVVAVGASAISVLATSTTTGAAYVHDHLTDLRIGNFLQIATVPGALVGATITVLIAHSGLVPILLILLGGVLVLPVPGAFARHREELPPPVTPDSLSKTLRLRGAYFDRNLDHPVTYEGEHTVPALEVMFGAGLVAGMFGIGSGVLNVIALDRSLRLPMKVSTATSNFMIGVTATAGISVLLVAGYINPVIAATVALGTIPGAYLGSRLLPRLSNRAVRWTFIPILVALAVELVVRGVSGL